MGKADGRAWRGFKRISQGERVDAKLLQCMPGCVATRNDGARGAAFWASIARCWPALKLEMLHRAYAGIRPKIERPGGSATDFIIQGPNINCGICCGRPLQRLRRGPWR